MITPLPPVDGADAAGSGRSATLFASVSITSQIDDAARALERTKRDLAVAIANQGAQAEFADSVRRHIEQIQWLNASASPSASAVQQAAVQQVSDLNANMTDAQRANLHALSTISELNAQIVQQYTRISALEERRKVIGASATTASGSTGADQPQLAQKKQEEAEAPGKAPSPAPGKDAALVALTDLLIASALTAADKKAPAE
jgi:hypothetical protein